MTDEATERPNPPCKECRKTDTVIRKTGMPTRTPGFHPDFECTACGFRWIDRSLVGRREKLEELRDAMVARWHGHEIY